jgi:hypothetical protein
MVSSGTKKSAKDVLAVSATQRGQIERTAERPFKYPLGARRTPDASLRAVLAL